jgi:hypothetical protein
MQLAIVLLRDAMARNDREAVSALLDQWMFVVDQQVIPQVDSLLITITEYDLARTLAEAAAFVDDPARQAVASQYVAYTRTALPAEAISWYQPPGAAAGQCGDACLQPGAVRATPPRSTLCRIRPTAQDQSADTRAACTY